MGLIDILWNAFTRSQDRQAHLEVNIKNGFFTYGPHPGEPMVIVTATNRSQHPIRVASVALKADSIGDQVAWDANPHPQSQLPGIIQPFDSAQAFMPGSGLQQSGIDLTRRIRAGVKLGDDTIVWSRPRVLWKEDLLAA
jgi:hypothetical protein